MRRGPAIAYSTSVHNHQLLHCLHSVEHNTTFSFGFFKLTTTTTQ